MLCLHLCSTLIPSRLSSLLVSPQRSVDQRTMLLSHDVVIFTWCRPLCCSSLTSYPDFCQCSSGHRWNPLITLRAIKTTSSLSTTFTQQHKLELHSSQQLFLWPHITWFQTHMQTHLQDLNQVLPRCSGVIYRFLLSTVSCWHIRHEV